MDVLNTNSFLVVSYSIIIIHGIGNCRGDNIAWKAIGALTGIGVGFLLFRHIEKQKRRDIM